MKVQRLLLLGAFFIVAFSSGAFAQWEPWNDTYEPPCWDNPDACSMETGTGSAATRMKTCTSADGCKDCIKDDETQKMRCGTLFMQNGSCKCEPGPPTAYSSGCVMEGDCTFRK